MGGGGGFSEDLTDGGGVAFKVVSQSLDMILMRALEKLTQETI